MLRYLIETIRGRSTDRIKARALLAESARAPYRAYDTLVANGSKTADATFCVGTVPDETGKPASIRLRPDDLRSHWLIQGTTGSGKTSFATRLVAERLRQQLPVGVIDCKTGFYDVSLRCAAAMAWLLSVDLRAAFVKRLAVINPFGTNLPPFNVCRVPAGSTPEVQAYEVTLILSCLFKGELSIHMENILRHLILLLSEFGLSLAEAPLVLQDELVRGLLVERSSNPNVKEFFFRTYPTLAATSSALLAARIQSLLLSERVRLMLGSDDCVDLQTILISGDPLFVFLGKGSGIPEEQVTVLGSLFLQRFCQAVFASGQNHGRYLVVLDEFFHLLTAPGLAERFETMLTSARSFGVFLAFVMHQFSQVSPSLRESMLANVDLMALFRTSAGNAEHFGDFLPTDNPYLVTELANAAGAPLSATEVRRQLVERLQRLPDRHCFWYNRRRSHRSLLLRVPDIVEPHEAVGLSARALDAFAEEIGIGRGGVALPADVLRQQLARREARLRELLRPPVVIIPATPEIAPEPELEPRAKRRRPRLG